MFRKLTASERFRKEARELTLIFIVVMVLRTFFYQPFSIPSGSMIPTLLVGDFLLVNKFNYGFGNETFPLRFKILNSRLFHSDPQRGDIVVFNNPLHENLDYIKRLVGLPGDRIQVKGGEIEDNGKIIKVSGGVLHINGESVKLKRIENFDNYTPQGRLDVTPQFIETLPNGVSHPILKKFSFGRGHYDNTVEFTVPEGHYFMMGDNRDDSIDSRNQQQVGFINRDLVLGQASIIFFSTEAKWYEIQNWIFGIRPKRFLTVLK
jgi:signal peptidase I